MGTGSITVHPPEEISRRMGGISVAQVIAILKDRGYAYTELKPGMKPWGRGRQHWGMTDEQIATMIAGQARKHPRPGESDRPDETPKLAPGLEAMGWDGKSRIRYPKKRGKV